jgi:threonine dehydrogenase-like Zn-dependent dehydrogenase
VKAVVVSGQDRISVASVPEPSIQDGRDAIVRVLRSAVCGTDLHVLGHCGEAAGRFIPGHEFVGEVTETGSAVASFCAGDLVAGADYTACGHCWWCLRGDHWHCPERRFFGTGSIFGPVLDGAQAEFVRVPHADVVLRRVPAGVSLDAAVFLGDTLATGYAAVQRAGYRPGDTLAVIGGGPVGQLTSLVAQACSAGAVIVVEPVKSRREFAVANGSLAADPGAARALADELTDGRGADAVVDAVGGGVGLDTALRLVRPGGTVVSVGVHTDQAWPLPAARAFADELTVRFVIGDFMRDAQQLGALLRSGAVDPTVVASEHVSLDDVPGAYHRMAERKTLKALVLA